MAFQINISDGIIATEKDFEWFKEDWKYVDKIEKGVRTIYLETDTASLRMDFLDRKKEELGNFIQEHKILSDNFGLDIYKRAQLIIYDGNVASLFVQTTVNLVDIFELARRCQYGLPPRKQQKTNDGNAINVVDDDDDNDQINSKKIRKFKKIRKTKKKI